LGEKGCRLSESITVRRRRPRVPQNKTSGKAAEASITSAEMKLKFAKWSGVQGALGVVYRASNAFLQMRR
jgi:hypothetical protein